MPFTSLTRRRVLVGAIACTLVVLALAVLVRVDMAGLGRLDTRLGRDPQAWSVDHPWLVHLLRAIQLAFSTIPSIVVTVLVGVSLWARGHRRAAYWAVAVMAVTSLTTQLLKVVLHRARPVWPVPVERVSGYAFPSGHSSAVAAGAGIAIVLTTMLVRRRGVRRPVIGVALLVAVVVGLDRVFLGVHHPSDVVGGWALGGFWVLATLSVFDLGPRHRTVQALPSAVPTTKKLAVVLNPAKVEDPGAFRAMVEQMAAEAGWTRPSWYETTVADPGRSMAERAAISGAELVVVCGGDGTLRTVCAELAGTGVSVGVVPAGTGNLLARNLGIPLYLRAAVDVALNGQDRAVDLVRVSGDGIEDDEHFLVMAGMGFDAAIMAGTNEQIKARVGWLAYVVSAARNLMYPAVRLEVCLDDGEWTRHRARTAVIGNVGYLQAGMPLIPDAAIDDGRIDVVLLNPQRFVSWIPLALRVLSKARRTDDTVNRMTGRSVAIRAAHDTPRQIDGDPIAPGRELVAVCLPGRLLIRVPR
ncbi:MAG: diacylglycerol kinase family protein [Nocardioidaceae bacterium]